MQSRAAVMTETQQPLEICDVEVADPGPGEVRIQMVASGVCHSDLHTLDGIHPYPVPAILGHEGAGVVESVGSNVTNVRPGDPVFLSWVPSCGRCATCTRGHPNLCENTDWSDNGTMEDGTVRFHLNGQPIHHYTISSFSEYSVVPATSCIPIADDLPMPDIALFGCAVMSGIGAVLNTAQVRPGESVAVIGCGGVGLNAIQGAAIANAGLIVAVDISDDALETAEKLGATHTVNSTHQDAIETIKSISDGGVDHSFEALGKKTTIELATQVTGVCGQTTLVGLSDPNELQAFNALDLVQGEKAIKGSWYGSSRPIADLPPLIKLYREGKIQVGNLSRHIDLDDINSAFDDLRNGVPGRSVIIY